jgi:hypothetical protein
MNLHGVAVLVFAVLLVPAALAQSAELQSDKHTAPTQKSHPWSVDDLPDYKPPPAATAHLSQNELDELRAKLISLWNPPAAVSTHPDQYVVTIRIRLSRDHRLVGQPEVLSNGDGSLFEATRDSAIQAVIQGQPYDMLSLTTYDQWKEIDINFDPREVYAPSDTSTVAPTKPTPEDRAFYTEYLPTLYGLTADCEKPLLNTVMPWSSLEVCEAYYKANNFIELACEREALFKQRTAPHLLDQHDIKWLSNVVNRRRACTELLAQEGKLSMWDKISRWWRREDP